MGKEGAYEETAGSRICTNAQKELSRNCALKAISPRPTEQTLVFGKYIRKRVV